MKKIEELERALEESFDILWNKALINARAAECLNRNYLCLKQLIQEIKDEKKD
jgi:hypothetical protein